MFTKLIMRNHISLLDEKCAQLSFWDIYSATEKTFEEWNISEDTTVNSLFSMKTADIKKDNIHRSEFLFD